MAKKQFSIQTELTAKIDDLTNKLNTANQRINYFKNKAKKNKGEAEIFNNLIKGASKFLPAIGAATAAQQVFQGTINTTQTAGDSWAVTTATMQGALEGFYRTIGTGDWSNFLDNILTSAAAARELTKDLDELGEHYISAKLKNAEIDIDIAKLNKELRIANARGDNELVIELEKKIIAKADDKYKNDLKAAEGTLKAFAKNITAITKVSYEEICEWLRNYSSETSEELRNQLEEHNKTILEYQKQISGIDMALANSMHSPEYKAYLREERKKWEEKIAIAENSLSTEAKIYQATQEAYDRTNDETIEAAINAQLQIQQITAQRINTTSRAEVTAAAAKKRMDEEEIKRLQEKLNLLAKTAPQELRIDDYQVEEFGFGEIKYGGLKGLTDELNELRQAQALAASPEIWQEYQAQITALEEQIARFKGINIDNNNELINQLNTEIQLIGTLSNAFGNLATMASNFGNENLAAMFNGMDAMLRAIQVVRQLQAAKAAEAMTNAAAEGAKAPFPTNLIAIASSVSAVLAALSSIPKFAVGGVVGGSSFTGDKILAGLNSGERVLTAEQNRIFEKLAANVNNNIGGEVRFKIAGDALEGVLNNRNRRRNINR